MYRWAIASLILLGGCEGGDQAAVAPLAARESVGAEELVIRSDFGRIPTLVVSDEGLIIVPDQQIPALFVYEADGTLRSTLGRRGQGPGEFEVITRVGWQGGSLWVYDPRLGRATLFGPDLQFARTMSGPAITAFSLNGVTVGSSTPSVLHLFPDGAYHAALFPRAPSGVEADLPATVYATLSPDGSVEKVIAQLPESRSSYFVSVAGYIGGGPYPFAIDPIYTIRDDGSRSALVEVSYDDPDAIHMRVTAFDPRGDTLYARTYPLEGVPIPAQVRDSALDAGANRLPAQAADAYRNEAWVPPIYPPVQGALIAKDGSVWVWLRPRTESEERYLVLDPEGDPQGQVTFPPGTEVEVVEGENAWAIVTDELDVQSVARFRVVPDPGH